MRGSRGNRLCLCIEVVALMGLSVYLCTELHTAKTLHKRVVQTTSKSIDHQ